MPPACPFPMCSTRNVQNTKCTVSPSKPLLGLPKLQEQNVAFQGLRKLQLPASSSLGVATHSFPSPPHSSPSSVFSTYTFLSPPFILPPLHFFPLLLPPLPPSSLLPPFIISTLQAHQLDTVFVLTGWLSAQGSLPTISFTSNILSPFLYLKI